MSFRIDGGMQARLNYQLNEAPEATEKDPLNLKQAIKDYYDEMLTGLTDEEREEIDKLCKIYLESNPLKTKSDFDAYMDYVKSLLMKFGYKGDVNEAAAQYAAVGSVEGTGGTQAASGQTTEIVTEPSGEKYLLITLPTGQIIKLKISDGAQAPREAHEAGEKEEPGASWKKEARGLVSSYENKTVMAEDVAITKA